MLLNLNFKFKQLDGSELDETTAAKTVAEVLYTRAEGINFGQAVSWAADLYNKGEIDIDKFNSELLKKAITSSNLFNFVKDQLVKAIELTQ
jgi:hypothetical protein